MTACETGSEAETEALGRRLGGMCGPGTLLALTGDLGSGKTRLVKGVASGLGVDPAGVTSPTFVLMNLYEGRHRIAHFDLYRLEGEVDLPSLGFHDVRDDSVVLVEWAEKVPEEALGDHLRVAFEVTGENSRRLMFRARGPGAGELLKRMNLNP